MKLWPLACLSVAAVGLFWHSGDPPDEWTVLIAGDMDGYLSPCGCTKPMTGGIRRLATAVKEMGPAGRTAFLVNGGLVSGQTRQDELKAETLAESLGIMGAAAINLSPSEAKLGSGLVASMDSLSGGKLICTSLEDSGGIRPAELARVGPFVVGGVVEHPEAVSKPLRGKPRSVDEAVRFLVEAARESHGVPLLLLNGSLAEAKAIAANHTELALIVYSAAGDPPPTPVRVGSCVLLTSGEFSKHVIRVHWRDGRIVDYASVSLGEDYANDPPVSTCYRFYLSRVDREGLLDQEPRLPTAAFAGSAKCAPCHAQAYALWKASGHAHALKDLEAEGESRDPDCVRCHVTGLDSTVGFVSRVRTPALADVGCEACHGPGAKHVADPGAAKLPKVHRTACARCHDLGHSPGFVFPNFWRRISHR
jgi:hypothetical protein